MKSFHYKYRMRQKGVVAVLAVIFLFAVVIFALSQTLGISASNSTDNMLQANSESSLMLAESGLEWGKGKLTSAGNSTDGTACAAIGGASAALATGKRFTLAAAANGCDSLNTNCTTCSITSTGNVGTSSRTITQTFALQAIPGRAGQGTTPVSTVTMTLSNTDTSYSALGIFELGNLREANSKDSNCVSISGGATCTTGWNLDSLNGTGSKSVYSLGAVVDLPASAVTNYAASMYTNKAVLDSGRNFSMTGIAIPALSTTSPKGLGTYWNDTNGGGANPLGLTILKGSASTQTNNGAATTGTSSTCDSAAASGTGTAQTCTHWCWGYDASGNNGANMLVMGLASYTSALGNGATSITFGPWAVPLTPAVRFPYDIPTGLAASLGAQGDVESEIWYYNGNKPYLSGARFTGSIAKNVLAASFTATTTNLSSTLNVTAVASGFLYVGDTIVTGAGIPVGTKITAGPTAGGTGSYTLSAAATASASVPVTSTRTQLTVTAVDSGVISLGEAISGTGVTAGTTIVSLQNHTSGAGNYSLSTPQTVSSTTITSGATSSGATVTVYGATAPSEGTIIAVRNGTGIIKSKTHVHNVVGSAPPYTFTAVDDSGANNAPFTALNGAQICGGICALFDFNSSSPAGTDFTVTGTSGLGKWAAGFACVNNAGTPSKIVVNGLPIPGTWTESIK